ncbi:MAG: cation transporter [Corynebacterium sp.]|nr:cation transporter [Corynebacterium sp.]
MATKTFDVEGMTCDHCVNAVTEEITALGNYEVSVDLGEGTVTVTGEAIDDAAITEAITEAGYEVLQA